MDARRPIGTRLFFARPAGVVNRWAPESGGPSPQRACERYHGFIDGLGVRVCMVCLAMASAL